MSIFGVSTVVCPTLLYTVVEGVATCGEKSDNDREHCQDPVIVAEQPRAESNRTHSTLYSKTNRFVKR